MRPFYTYLKRNKKTTVLRLQVKDKGINKTVFKIAIQDKNLLRTLLKILKGFNRFL